MNIAEIESKLKDLVEQPFDKGSFIYGVLEAYEAPKATITKLKQGTSNQAESDGDLLWKKRLFFRAVSKKNLMSELDSMGLDSLTRRHSPRFLVVTDGEDLLARDLKNDQFLDVKFAKLNDAFDFFLPLAGIEKYEGVTENPADIKATSRLAKLYDAILEANPGLASETHTHELNLFMTRILFCFFAEDTSIFSEDLFTNTVFTISKEDGSDTAEVIASIFKVMNLPDGKRIDLPEYLNKFPYVNGGLFSAPSLAPVFSPKARRLLKECSSLTWSEINPDIFGSMIQAVVEPGMRGDMGMHYTSVPNIMKVLQPLFLMSLEEEFELSRDSEPKLRKLLERIYGIRIFDPACGSGNFLIIAYRELRKIESRVFDRLKAVAKQSSFLMTGIRLSQFYGIELADFACETAKLSLWIAEYQMNEAFKVEFGSAPPSLPLRESGQIIHGNACSIEWSSVCPESEAETYVVGNPPYLGSSNQSKDQKRDVANNFSTLTGSYKNLDYVSIWFVKAAKYCSHSNSKCAFVATNSICQGEQVELLWPLIFRMNIEIDFAHQFFKWRNNASKNAGVTCVIVGIRKIGPGKKRIFHDGIFREVKNIGPYLIEMDNLIIKKTSTPIGPRPPMLKGNQPTDGGHLILSPEEKNELLSTDPRSKKFIRRLYGSQEFIKGIERYCLWIEDDDLEEARSIAAIASRIKAVRQVRLESDAPSTVAKADESHRFIQIQDYGKAGLIIPSISSETRRYFPVGVFSKDSIVNNSSFALYDTPLYIFAILSSRLHSIWVSTAGGQLETRLRYSNTLVYNTFPIPDLSKEQINSLEFSAANIIKCRESHVGVSISYLYDPETMPKDLKDLHEDLDQLLETIYIGRSFKNDSERLECLFRMYSMMVNKDRTKNAVKLAEIRQASLFGSEGE